MLNIIEICEMPEDKLAGRVRIKMVAHEIYPTSDSSNLNGISWQEEYTNIAKSTCIGMPFVVDYVNKEIGLISGHGRMSVEDGDLEFEGESVGTVQDAYIDNVEIDGVIKKCLIVQGFIYEQRNRALVKFLREQINGNHQTIYGSIEINGDENGEITYLNGKYNPDGTLNMHRVPSKYQYSAMAILYLEDPADRSAQILEIASLQNQNATGNTVSDKNEKGDSIMNQELETKLVEVNSLLATANEEVAKLNKTVSDKDQALAEVNEIVVEANKCKEELNSQLETMTKELEECKAELQAYKEKEAQTKEEEKKAEVNSYMKNEISKNGFTETEINSFAELVEACDLDGIKKLESELCTAKFKAEINAKKEVEVNSKKEDKPEVEVFSMFTTKEPKKVVIGDEIPTLM